MLPLLLLLACDRTDDTVKPIETDPPAETDVVESDAPETDLPVESDAPVVDRATAVCQRWNEARVDLAESNWTGNALACQPGGTSAEAKARMLAVLNAWRFLVEQPEVTNDPALDADAQKCALMMHANRTLDHYPPAGWRCWSPEGAAAAGRSNLATSPAISAIDMYIQDWGNEQTLGHRRWLFNNELGPVGIGSTSEFSCLDVGSGVGASEHRWVAWPAPGPVPLQAIQAGGSLSTDETGWSVQSDDVDLSAATVTVRDAGATLPIAVTQLLQGYGSRWAVKFRPTGWRSQVGHSYDVELSGVSEPIRYTVEIVDCE